MVKGLKIKETVPFKDESRRSNSLDALRGLSILLMVLSSSIAFGILPGWMYHAQVPPPSHVFNPELPGITWVDLVFPFFLFSMGAALPLALNKKTGTLPAYKVLIQIFQRYFLLILFAVFTVHARASVMSQNPSFKEYLISIFCFVTLFLIYAKWNQLNTRLENGLRILGFLLAGAFLAFYPFKSGSFDPSNSDVIIVVLANMALFGSVIWWLTSRHKLLRIGVLPFVMAILSASGIEKSINSYLFNISPVGWMYKFIYLKYLFIIIPGTFAGEWLVEAIQSDRGLKPLKGIRPVVVAILPWAIVLCNLIGLYQRWLIGNLVVSIILCAILLNQLGRLNNKINLLKFAQAGVYLLLLGLFFEAYEGGIKKDFSTYSYYFVSAGLAFLILLSFIVVEKSVLVTSGSKFLADTGKNPMIAYTAGNLFLIPVLKISGADVWLDSLNFNFAAGLFRGLVFTSVVALITIYFTRRKIFWRT